jgi:hypothetical protein
VLSICNNSSSFSSSLQSQQLLSRALAHWALSRFTTFAILSSREYFCFHQTFTAKEKPSSWDHNNWFHPIPPTLIMAMERVVLTAYMLKIQKYKPGIDPLMKDDQISIPFCR